MKKMLGLLALALLVSLPGCGCCKSKKKEDRRAKSAQQKKDGKGRAAKRDGMKRDQGRQTMVDAE